ncbi:MAG: hypothetical protein NTX96_01605 [Candidatus Zambryskibacteria bacterium]|nr:hypothetical protein [Candidatus Zambryskibacteria bacterium]
MPNSKTLSVLIICFGIVASFYLSEKNSKNIPPSTQNTNSVFTNPYINLSENVNNDWKKILANSNPNQSFTTVLTNEDPATFNETTLTAQMSRDIFSRYLLIAKQEGGVTSDDATKIANEVLSSPEYTKIARVIYSETNLHVIQKTDKETLKKYSEVLNQSILDGINSIKSKGDPLTIFSAALKADDPNKLAGLDYFILSNKNFIDDLLQMEVPKEIVSMHIDLLNASSNSLADLESMSQTFVDPAKSLVAITQYLKDADNFQNAIENINNYYKNRFGVKF